MKSLSLVMLLILVSCGSFTPVEVGNGGHGVLKNGKVFLLDLHEAGLDDVTITPVEFKGRAAEILQTIKSSFPEKYFPVELLSAKLAQIDAIDPILFHTLLISLKQLSWRFSSERLRPITLQEESGPKTDIVLVAHRYMLYVAIDEQYWELMSDSHKVALMLHEVFYSLLSTISVGRSKDSIVYERQSARRTRQITRIFFKTPPPVPAGLGLLLNTDEIPYFGHDDIKNPLEPELEASRGKIGAIPGNARSMYVGPIRIEIPEQEGLKSKVLIRPGEIVAEEEMSRLCLIKPKVLFIAVGESAHSNTYFLDFRSLYMDKNKLYDYRIKHSRNHSHRLSLADSEFEKMIVFPEYNCADELRNNIKTIFDRYIWHRQKPRN